MMRRPPPSIAADHARTLITFMQDASAGEALETCILKKPDRRDELLRLMAIFTLLPQGMSRLGRASCEGHAHAPALVCILSCMTRSDR